MSDSTESCATMLVETNDIFQRRGPTTKSLQQDEGSASNTYMVEK